jgi:hypothetical protein
MRIVSVGVPERTGVVFVEVSVEVSVSVSFEIVDGVSETGGVMEIGIEGDSWMTLSSAGARISAEPSVVCASCISQ